jgi:uncharacterized protein (TIGR03437 family)
VKHRAWLALVAFAAAAPAPAYYHFIQYLNGASVPEKFDLTALPSKTVTFYVSENGPTIYSQNDTFNSVLSQIRQAAAVWNGVATSDLRVAFGGLENGSTPQNTPGGDIVFEDLPPGLYGYGGPTSTLADVTPANGSPFVPITRSTVHLNLNLTVLPGPSYNETFFMTVVHEMGHALGLQHTFTSATMSQATTRATSLSHPIDNDDIAGISVLYPNAGFPQFGSITGRITAGGQGIHLASVVAIRAGSGAVSGVTNPDGTYRIDGIPPGQYFVYVHTMPPDANIYGPWNADGSVASGSGPVNTVFYTPGGQGVAAYSQAIAVGVQAGQTTANVNIATTSTGSVPIYDGGVYAYLNNNTSGPIKPAPVNMNGGPATVIASAVGLGSNGQAPGLGVQLMGGSVGIQSNGIVPYLASGYTYIEMFLEFNLGAQSGAQHVVFSTPGYTYVLPSAINLTQKPPPTISAVSNNADGTVTITGTNWASDTSLYFDGIPAPLVSLDPNTGSAVAVPPPGAPGETSILSAYNTDGQNSQFVQSAAPVTYLYPSAATPQITSISPASLPAGAEALIDITGTGFNFTAGLTTAGFGSSDILVRHIFVLSPSHLQVDVAVAPNAALSTSDVSVIAGFQLATASSAFQITAAQPGLPSAVSTLINAVPGLNGSYPGAIVSLYGTNLATANATPVITIGGQTASILYASPTQINLTVPSNLSAGPAVLTLNNGAAAAYPVLVNIDTPPAAISAVQTPSGAYITSTSPAHQGDLLIVSLTGFAAAGTNIANNQVTVGVNGVSHPALQVTQAGAVYQVSFLLTQNETVGQSQQLVVYLNGRSSLPASIPVAYPSGSFTN